MNDIPALSSHFTGRRASASPVNYKQLRQERQRQLQSPLILEEIERLENEAEDEDEDENE
ncbi:MAG: hypothetical protein ABI068_11025 [Ktedonobacterales bacterium]